MALPPDEVDRLARRLVRRAAPVVFGLAEGEERDAVYRLRHRAVIERGWAAPEDLPDGRERDEDDSRGLLVVAHEGDEIVACVRLLLPEPGWTSPVERIFAVDPRELAGAAHVDRLVVARGRGGPGRRVLLGLMGQSWLTLRARGLSAYTAILSPAVLRMWLGLGFEERLLAGPQAFWGEQRSAFVMSVARPPGAGHRAPQVQASRPRRSQ
jgi:hypothetical protein